MFQFMHHFCSFSFLINVLSISTLLTWLLGMWKNTVATKEELLERFGGDMIGNMINGFYIVLGVRICLIDKCRKFRHLSETLFLL